MTRHDENRLAVVERYWPYDGPHDAESVTDAAVAVADLVRYLNNASRGSALRNPADLYTVVTATARSMQRMDQLFDQLATGLKVDADYPVGVFNDEHPDADPAPDMHEAAGVLWECQDIAGELRAKLDAAAEQLSCLGLDDEAGEQR